MNKVIIALGALVFSTAAFAEGGALLEFNAFTKSAIYFLAVAIAAAAGTKAQSGAASVALEGIARNPSAADKIMTPMILGLALMESLVIFTLISVFLG